MSSDTQLDQRRHDDAPVTTMRAFHITGNGEVSLDNDRNGTMQAGYVWAGLGIFGFVFFRLAAAARSKWGRDDEEEEEDEEELSLTQSAVLN